MRKRKGWTDICGAFFVARGGCSRQKTVAIPGQGMSLSLDDIGSPRMNDEVGRPRRIGLHGAETMRSQRG